ncbi:hypothetical protein F3Y22_tig00111303pilonHSYRG00077 [Hibiscus syriacus]|uniref:C2 NT-type domain-containing protein n=1 Tax=Hibiscus syriacus TaxID=106335 RepID=A0A6A2YR34_HIBSY|nr:hypothetical protein F3Y22_tig00111303pilonHSYRG00077 [Hibiscus syriacus]
MVVKMMKWRPWPPLVSKKYEVKLIVRRLEGWGPVREDSENPDKLTVEVRWNGPKASLGSLRRTVKRNFTKEVDGVDENGVVLWDEEFQTLCSLSAYKDNIFHPWEITFSVLNGLNQGHMNKFPVIIGTASLNLAEYASSSEKKEFELNVPLMVSAGAAESGPQLYISLRLLELRTAQETVEPVQRALVPVVSPVRSGETLKKPVVRMREVKEPSLLPSSKRSILPWRKRKLSFRSPKVKGEPLLKKSYGDEGGDDIDFDCRQLSSDESLAIGWYKADEDSSANRSLVSEFGDDNFAIGSWEQKEVISPD